MKAKCPGIVSYGLSMLNDAWRLLRSIRQPASRRVQEPRYFATVGLRQFLSLRVVCRNTIAAA
jgi:hypothetical protein